MLLQAAYASISEMNSNIDFYQYITQYLHSIIEIEEMVVDNLIKDYSQALEDEYVKELVQILKEQHAVLRNPIPPLFWNDLNRTHILFKYIYWNQSYINNL